MSPLTFAIGDVHGCLDMLQSLLGACEAHAAGRPARYVFLGDYIDRGPDSRGVIQLLMRRQQAQPGASVCLRGNHEQMAIMAHQSVLALPLWLQNGGAATRFKGEVERKMTSGSTGFLRCASRSLNSPTVMLFGLPCEQRLPKSLPQLVFDTQQLKRE